MIDTIHLLGFSKDMAEYHIINIKHTHPDIAVALGKPVKVNGVGNAKLCADLATMMQILWLLPRTDRTSAFRLKCANDIVRQMKGDASLIVDLEQNRQTLQQTGGIHLHEGPMAVEALPTDLQARALTIAREELALQTGRLALQTGRLEFKERRERSICEAESNHTEQAMKRMKCMESLGLGCDRNKIATMDRITNYDARHYICDTSTRVVAVDTTPMQISEIMEFNLHLPADTVRKCAIGAGGAVADGFRAKFGEKFKFAKAFRDVAGRKREVNAYNPEHVPLAEQLLREYLENK